MASIGKDRNGRKRILFVAEDGSRKTIRLGKLSMRQALAFKVKLEALMGARFTGNMDDETARWIADLPDDVYERLHAVSLVAPRASTTLSTFIEGYITERADVKTATSIVYGHTKRNLIDYFGADKPLREITSGEADQWRLYLIEQGLSDNTVRRRCGIAKQFMRAAKRHKLISENPFDDLPSWTRGNAKRFYFITRQEAEKVLEACPDSQWRLVFSLARFGGLRTPSESLALKWQDIDWEHSRMIVHSSKTEHHEGGESRVVPIFPELLPCLREAFEEAEEGSEYVITRYRQRNVNLRTQLLKIISRAGLKAWPKLFQNLRSSRETELSEQFPLHVVVAWLGNTQQVAMKHYLQVTDEHFEQAVNPEQKSAQNTAQYDAVRGSKEQKERQGENTQTQVFTGSYDTVRNSTNVTDGRYWTRTLLPVTPRNPILGNVRTESGTHDAPKPQFDPDLQKIIKAWPTLPEAIKAEIINLISRRV